MLCVFKSYSQVLQYKANIYIQSTYSHFRYKLTKFRQIEKDRIFICWARYFCSRVQMNWFDLNAEHRVVHNFHITANKMMKRWYLSDEKEAKIRSLRMTVHCSDNWLETNRQNNKMLYSLKSQQFANERISNWILRPSKRKMHTPFCVFEFHDIRYA